MKVSNASALAVHAILEPTAAYQELGAAKGIPVSLVSSAQIRNFAKGMAVLSKTDQIDALLYEAAQVLLTRVQKWSWLKAWAVNVARRRGLQKAIVALARRMAVIMHRLWSDDTEFRWAKEGLSAVA